MRYIRLFEEIEVKDNLILKDYVVWQPAGSEVEFEVFKVTGVGSTETDSIPVKHLYVYKDGKLKEPDKNADTNKVGFTLSKIEDSLKNRIVFQSDDLQECINILHMLSNLKKYNI